MAEKLCDVKMSGGRPSKTGTFALSTSASTRVELGFRPKYIAISTVANTGSTVNNGTYCVIYDSSIAQGVYLRYLKYNGENVVWYLTVNDAGVSAGLNIDDTGFSLSAASSWRSYADLHYFAIG